ncbi:hypothetical protein BSKO_07648 [Bryopsis sp. KO-2023]|nr:hypothetical protein BSKO_07648 [Bryopsis sp. KO-2023]
MWTIVSGCTEWPSFTVRDRWVAKLRAMRSSRKLGLLSVRPREMKLRSSNVHREHRLIALAMDSDMMNGVEIQEKGSEDYSKQLQLHQLLAMKFWSTCPIWQDKIHPPKDGQR